MQYDRLSKQNKTSGDAENNCRAMKISDNRWINGDLETMHYEPLQTPKHIQSSSISRRHMQQKRQSKQKYRVYNVYILGV